MRGLIERPAVRARVVHTVFRHLSDGVPYLEVRFQRVDPVHVLDFDTALRARYWLTPGALPRTIRGLAAVGLVLDLDADDRWVATHAYGPSHAFDLPLVDVLCDPAETHGRDDVRRTFVVVPADG